MRGIGLLVLLFGFATSFSHPTSSWLRGFIEEGLKQLADGSYR
jgi:hypothetical protein